MRALAVAFAAGATAALISAPLLAQQGASVTIASFKFGPENVSANAKAAPFCVAISLEGATPAKVNTPAEIASQPSAPTDPPIRSPPRPTPKASL